MANTSNDPDIAEAELKERIVVRLQRALPNDIETEVDAILADEPLCTKRLIIFALGRCRSEDRVWLPAAREVQERLVRAYNIENPETL